MRAKLLLRAAMVILLLAAAARLAPAQGLADVARQEQERRKTIQKPAKVLTNDDLRSLPPVIPAVAPSPAEGAQPAPADASKDQAGSKPAAGDSAAEPAKDQAYWSGRSKALQTQLQRDQTFAVALQSRINALTTQYVNQSDPIQQAAVANDRQDAVNELNRLTKQIEDDKKAIADLQEEARRARVPPGWLR
jgi:hypothetical protein